jgi:hypothetical protein
VRGCERVCAGYLRLGPEFSWGLRCR